MHCSQWNRAALAAALLVLPQQSFAEPLLIDGVPLAKRIVLVNQAALRGDPAALAAVETNLRAAAKSVCNEQYRGDMVSISHGCVVGSVADAMGQLNRLRSQPLAAHAPDRATITVAVQSR